MPTVVLGVTGCIGAYKACEVLRELQKRGVDVHVVMTQNATRFVGAGRFPFSGPRRARLVESRPIGDVVLLRYALSPRFADRPPW